MPQRKLPHFLAQLITAALLLYSTGLVAVRRCLPELFAHLAHLSEEDQELAIGDWHGKFLDEPTVSPVYVVHFRPGINWLELTAGTAPHLLKKMSKEAYTFEATVDLPRAGDYSNEAQQKTWQETHDAFVKKASEHPISLDTLLGIHQRLAEKHYFIGYERRRVREDFRSHKITREVALQKLKAVEEGTQYTPVAHSALAGKLRSDTTDFFVYEGDHFDSKGQRYVTAAELGGLARNKCFVHSYVHRRPDGNFNAQFYFLPAERVETETKKLIAKAAALLAKAPTDEAYAEIAILLERDLMSLHPFLDVNGRAIRLFIDTIFAKRSLPLPARPIEGEYSTDPDILVRHYFEQMKIWQEKKNKTP